MPNVLKLVLCCCVLMLASCTNLKKNPQSLPKGLYIDKNVTVPNTVKLRYYIPQTAQEFKFFAPWRGVWVEPGPSYVKGLQSAMSVRFTDVKPLVPNVDDDFAWLLVLDPEWEPENGNVTLTVKYRLLGIDGKVLLKGVEKSKASLGDLADTAAFYNTTVETSVRIAVHMLNNLHPSPEKFGKLAKISSLDLSLLADMKEPISTGTGFFINQTGDILTAAHVMDQCLITKAAFGDKEIQVKSQFSSHLLDVAVLKSDFGQVPFLPLRAGDDIVLGEPVANVGFPLQGVLSTSANLTRGNLSSATGITGSLGHIQFSAPIQPGSSGGPVVSDGGEILGMAVSTLNINNLIEKGIVPQNVNFALNRSYIRKFLDKHKIAYSSSAPSKTSDANTANQKALSAVVKLSCYQ